MKFIIDEKYLTDNTSVDSQTNPKEIKASFKSVTDYLVKILVGIPLYEVLETQTDLTPRQNQLLEYLRYFMALRVEHEMMFNLVKIGNKGVTQDATVANLEIVKAKRQDIEARAGQVKKTILEYIKTYREDFPEFYPQTPPSSSSQSSSTSLYSAGIVFDNQPKIYIQ